MFAQIWRSNQDWDTFYLFLHDDKSSILIFSQRTINNYDYQLALINWYRILRFTTHLLIPVSHYFLLGFSKVTINKKSFKNLKPLFLIIKSVSFYENSLCNNITILVQRNISNNRNEMFDHKMVYNGWLGARLLWNLS